MARSTTLVVIAVLSLNLIMDPLVVSGNTDEEKQMCLQNFTDSLTHMSDKNQLCPFLSRYENCLLDAMNVSSIPETMIPQLEHMVNLIRSRYGVHCNISIRSGIKSEKESVSSEWKACFYDNQYHIKMAGMNVTSPREKSEKMCPLLKKMFQCIIDKYDQTIILNTETLRKAKLLVNTVQSKAGVVCDDIDVESMLKSKAGKTTTNENGDSDNWAGRVVPNLSVVQTLFLALLMAIELRAT